MTVMNEYNSGRIPGPAVHLPTLPLQERGVPLRVSDVRSAFHEGLHRLEHPRDPELQGTLYHDPFWARLWLALMVLGIIGVALIAIAGSTL